MKNLLMVNYRYFSLNLSMWIIRMFHWYDLETHRNVIFVASRWRGSCEVIEYYWGVYSSRIHSTELSGDSWVCWEDISHCARIWKRWVLRKRHGYQDTSSQFAWNSHFDYAESKWVQYACEFVGNQLINQKNNYPFDCCWRFIIMILIFIWCFL